MPDMATVSATEVAKGNGLSKRSFNLRSNGETSVKDVSNPEHVHRPMKKKYRHVAAVHAKPRTSCLSNDAETTPSFIGFRNLMIIVLSKSDASCYSICTGKLMKIVVGNLRLMVENFNKVVKYRSKKKESN